MTDSVKARYETFSRELVASASRRQLGVIIDTSEPTGRPPKIFRARLTCDWSELPCMIHVEIPWKMHPENIRASARFYADVLVHLSKDYKDWD